MPLTARWIYALVAAACAALLSYALYTEYFDGLNPCPLCMTQRGFYVLAGLTGLAAALINPGRKGRYLASGLVALFCAGGAAVAGRQVWLQSLPADQVPACGPSLEYMFANLPFGEAFRTLMMGDGNCAEVVWTLFGLSMPNWSLICFVVLAGAAIIAALPWVKR
ncbi:disulfide bond formation protein B [Spongiibacter taiwanensis]|uniref:disulfide bond formation protein B n=1 Tax=Spongiibacter taiwanensis TaxID=1748242 RepID=UPI00203568ED|nr:disulfide bond formation protein B [Spongiibacter taiwanensis]USA41671.1 disulfide bond formation protein B [Spongiibacter taiwanensis]